MDENIEFLNYIYQNCSMGIITTEQLIDISDDNNFVKLLKKQLTLYKQIKYDTTQLLHERKKDEKELGSMTKIMSYITINVKTLIDKSSSHIAEMMIQGSTMGVIDVRKNLNKYENVDINTIQVAEKLLNIEENNIEDLKDFLN